MASGDTRRLSRGELVDISGQEAAQTYLAGLPKELIETVDTVLLVGGSVLPVHKFVLIFSSAILRELFSSQGSTTQEDQVQMIPLMDDGQACVQDALAYLYRRMLLSTEPPELTSITMAKHSAKFGHKYAIRVLLDESDGFINRWCKKSFSTPLGGNRSTAQERQQHAMTAAQEVIEWTVFAESASLQLTLGVCESWFVFHIWDLKRLLDDPTTDKVQLSGMMTTLSSDVLARILSGVAKVCGRQGSTWPGAVT